MIGSIAGLGVNFNSILLILLNGIGVTVLAKLITIWPRLTELKMGERRGDIDGMSKRIAALEASVEKANEAAGIAKEAAHILQMQMISLQNGFALVAGELERRDPTNPILQHARELIAQAATSDMGVGLGFKKVATLRKEPGK